ncbi:MAG: hypothetical protein WA683_19050, partial [Pseudolabrys sp.]
SHAVSLLNASRASNGKDTNTSAGRKTAALRHFNPVYVGSGHQRKCSEGSNDFRYATLSGHDRARLAGPLSATTRT